MNSYKKYLFTYSFEGSQWGFSIMAKDADEAKRRIKALTWAHYNGEVVARIPVPAGGLVTQLLAWLDRRRKASGLRKLQQLGQEFDAAQPPGRQRASK